MLTSSHSTCSATQCNLNYPQEEEHQISKDFLHSHQLSTYSSLPEPTRDVEVTPTWPSICLTQFEDTVPKAFCSPHCYNHKSCHLVVGFQLIKSMFQDFWPSGEMIKLHCYSREETEDMLSHMYWEVRIFLKGTSSSPQSFPEEQPKRTLPRGRDLDHSYSGHSKEEFMLWPSQLLGTPRQLLTQSLQLKWTSVSQGNKD